MTVPATISMDPQKNSHNVWFVGKLPKSHHFPGPVESRAPKTISAIPVANNASPVALFIMY